MAADSTAIPLIDLIDYTKDGEWGNDEPDTDRIKMLVVRGADFKRLRVGDLVDIPKRYIDRSFAERKQLHADDILIETAGGTKDQSTGRTVLVKKRHIESAGLPMTCASFARFMRFDNTKVDPHFIYWWFQNLYANGEMESHQVQHTGVARFQFTRFIKTTCVQLPSLSEQHAIANILDAFDDKIELNSRMNETLEAIVQALFKSWFIDFYPVRTKAEEQNPKLPKDIADLFPDSFEDSESMKIPTGWHITSLGELFPNDKDCVLTGPFGSNLHAHDYSDVGVPLILVKHVIKGQILEDGLPLVGEHKLSDLERYRLKVGDIVFTRVGAVGRSAYVYPRQANWLISGQMLRVRVADWKVLNPRYLAQIFLEKSFTDMVEGYALGTTRPSLNTNLLRSFKFIVPHQKLMNIFADQALKIDSLVQTNRYESRTLAALRDALLPKLISGELRLPDAERLAREASI